MVESPGLAADDDYSEWQPFSLDVVDHLLACSDEDLRTYMQTPFYQDHGQDVDEELSEEHIITGSRFLATSGSSQLSSRVVGPDDAVSVNWALLAAVAERALASQLAEAALRRKIEHLEDKIVTLANSRDLLRELYQGKVAEVDRLTLQLDALRTMLDAQKRTDHLDTKTIAAVTSAVVALLSFATSTWGKSPQRVEDAKAAAIEVHTVCEVEINLKDAGAPADTQLTPEGGATAEGSVSIDTKPTGELSTEDVSLPLDSSG